MEEEMITFFWIVDLLIAGFCFGNKMYVYGGFLVGAAIVLFVYDIVSIIKRG